MTYTNLLKKINYAGTPPQGEVALVTQDSRRVTAGAVYVCVQGKLSDGHEFAKKALEKGAGMIVTQRTLGLANEVTVKDSREAYSLLCQNFFGNPASRLKLVGITGTNGKSTVASILKQALEILGHPCGLIGTIQSEIRDIIVPAKFTTPEAWDLNAILARMEKAGCTHVVMEASSQALVQKRLFGVQFALGIFTNLSQDHLDYHITMENYYEAKKMLFAQSDRALFNVDDEWGKRLMQESGCLVKRSFSLEGNEADFAAKNIDYKASGVKFAFLGDGFLERMQFNMPGEYSAQNALAACSASVMLGEKSEEVAKAVSSTRAVSGRCEVLYTGKFTVICDFAHTADAIEKLLASLKPFVKARMVVLFGCAGERDAGKRAGMAKAVANYANEIVLTADNPRGESIESTMLLAVEYLKTCGKLYHVVEERKQAVRFALESMQESDLLVLCGKGHEDYQAMDGVTVYCSEKEIVQEWLAQQGLI